MNTYRLSPRSASARSLLRTQSPLYDFLIPSFTNFPRSPRTIRHLSTTPRSFSASPSTPQPNPHTPNEHHTTNPSHPTPRTGAEAITDATPSKNPLTQAQKDFLTSALRVNQAGELAATLIYTAQTPPITNAHPHLRPLMAHMYDQEAGHFKTFNHLLAKHRIRPTALTPIWSLAASALGWGTGLMGREAAMACTEAVETEIGTHYNEQVQVLLEMQAQMKARGEELGEELTELLETIRRIRDEELEHLDHAVEHDAKKAVPHELLTGVIRAGCRGAIWVSERV
ncbi:5a2f1d63-9c2b-43da-a9cf-4a517379875d [Sclerotinia trifoliorum]|uniref:5-demethoxyubiquinone hydroxylase, mitochondrial n=1 Tax=Sclerotinia trifoliorum TaxID=28548 RepID=A0A8H2VTZ3_9HELO|nr:5a2f1d63-9c2b-43da-a9cf-4a517379875d [Sclerotinia trifoliorum]